MNQQYQTTLDIDRLGLAMKCTDKRLQQNMYYYGYDCYTMVNNVLVFGPDWKVFFAAITNYPGSWVDGTLTACFFVHIKERIGDYKICVDQGFPRSGDVTGILCTGEEYRLIALSGERQFDSSI